MVPLKKKRETRCERYEAGEGNLCGWIQFVAPLIGAAASYLLNDSEDNSQATTTQTSNSQGSSTPTWSSEQKPYLWSGQTWNPDQYLPQYTADALNWGQALAAGVNPVSGQTQFLQGQDLVNNILGQGNNGVLGNLFRTNVGFSPSLLTNNPFYSGQNVVDPQNLWRGEGITSAEPGASTTREQAPSGQDSQGADADLAAYLDWANKLQGSYNQVQSIPAVANGTFGTVPGWGNGAPPDTSLAAYLNQSPGLGILADLAAQHGA